MMTDADLDSLSRRLAPILAPLVAKELAAVLNLKLPPPPIHVFNHRLTVPQFAFCAERSAEWVRRNIRGQVIPRDLVSGPPYLIHPKALAKFGVTPEITAERVALLQSRHPET